MGNNPLTILCLGGEGFLGKSIQEVLAPSFHCLSVDRCRSHFYAEKSSNNFSLINPYIHPVPGSYSKVIHLIDNQSVDHNEFEQEEGDLLQYVLTPPVDHLILFSSAVVYANPESLYGQRKRMLERIATEMARSRGVILTILRLFNVYGPYQLPFRQGSFIANVLFNHFSGKTTEISDLSARRDFSFSQDVGKFVSYALHEKLNGTYDLATRGMRTLGQIVDLLEREVLHESIRVVDTCQLEVLPSPESCQRFPADIPLTEIEIGLKKTADFYRKNLPRIEEIVNRQ